MALTQKKIDGLRAMYHNSGSTANEKTTAKAILERNGESVDVPKKASSGGTGTNPGYAKGGFDTGSGSFGFDIKFSEAAFNDFFREQFGRPRETPPRKDQSPPERIIFIHSIEKKFILDVIEKRVTGSIRMDNTYENGDTVRYHFKGLPNAQAERIIKIYQNLYSSILQDVHDAINLRIRGY